MKRKNLMAGFNFRAREGQSLMEILIALGVAVIVIVALASLTSVSIRNVRYAKNKALATQYAQEWIEEARRWRGESSSTFFQVDSCDGFDDDPNGKGVFDRDRDCTLKTENTKMTMEVMVTVGWIEGGRTHEVKLETALTNWR